MVRISIAEILAARNYPPDRHPKSGWTRELIESWGVPWPTPIFWMLKLSWSGIPFREPTEDDVRASPILRSSIWVPPEPVGAPPARVEPPPVLPEPPPPPLPPVARSRPAASPKPKKASKPSPPPQGALF